VVCFAAAAFKKAIDEDASMITVEIMSDKPEGFFCPLCGAPFYSETPDFCEHLLFCYDMLAGDFGYLRQDLPLPEKDEPVPEDLFECLPEGAVCFIRHTNGPGGLQNTSYVAVEMGDRVVGEMSTAELAKATGLTAKRIQQLAAELIRNGLAHRVGRVLVCSQLAVGYIRNRPEKRGAHFKRGL
jgi:hypothetical protein